MNVPRMWRWLRGLTRLPTPLQAVENWENLAQLSPSTFSMQMKIQLFWFSIFLPKLNARNWSLDLQNHEMKFHHKINFDLFRVYYAQWVLDVNFALMQQNMERVSSSSKYQVHKHFFPESNTNVKFWQMLKNIFVNKMAKFQCLGKSSPILLQCLV